MTRAAGRPASSSVALHWLVAVSIFGMLALGYYVSTLPRGQLKTDWVQLHKSFGMIVFALVLWRVGWRMVVGFPESLGAGWQRTAARVSHFLLLAATIVMPLSGIVRSLAYARPVSVFGVPVIPQLFAEKNEALNEAAGAVHDFLSFGLVALIALHVLAALKHHFIDRDDTLRRMAPRVSSGRGGLRDDRT